MQEVPKLGLLFFSDTICGVWHMLCMYNRLIAKACCQVINSNLTQGIQLKNYLVLLNSLEAFQEETTILKAAWFKIDKKS